MSKIKQWLWDRRTGIGYTIGGANLGSGIGNILIGNVVVGVFWLAIGAFIIWDVRTYK